MAFRKTNPPWTWFVPLLAWLVMAAAIMLPGAFMFGLAAIGLIGSVIAAVHHAEVVAHRVGEPFGTLVLAVAVTVIEVALIVSVMLSGGAGKEALPRDTVFAAIMICCNGIVGLCLLVGGMHHREQGFQIQGASAALAVLCALSVLSMVLPSYAITVPGPGLSTSQLVFPESFRSCCTWSSFSSRPSGTAAIFSRRATMKTCTRRHLPAARPSAVLGSLWAP